jgi:hypothetical protein
VRYHQTRIIQHLYTDLYDLDSVDQDFLLYSLGLFSASFFGKKPLSDILIYSFVEHHGCIKGGLYEKRIFDPL